MKWSKLFLVALKSIARNKMRSLLTMLGIIIGVGAVICLVSLGQGSQQGIEQQVATLGTNLLIIVPGSNQHGGVQGGAGSLGSLALSDVTVLRKNALLLQAVSPEIRIQSQVVAEANNWNTTIYGGDAEYLSIRNYQLSSGRSFNSREKVQLELE